MPVIWPVMVYAVSALVMREANNEMTRQFEVSADLACTMVQNDMATDDDLRVQVFQPVAHAVYGQLKTLRTETDSAPQKAPVSPLTSHYLATTPPDLSAATSPLLPNHPVILANAAASVADTIIERYRVALRHADANLPTLVTFRSPGENGEGNLARISMDVRNYCLKLDALNGEAVSPDSHGQRQP